MTERAASRREAVVHASALAVGPSVSVLLLETTAFYLLWRSAALAVSLTLVGAAVVRLIMLGRAEWLRERPGFRHYVQAIARFFVAFVLVVVATT